LFNILTKPVEALLEAKQDKSMTKALSELVVASLLFAIAAFIGAGQLFAGFISIPSVASLVAGGQALLAVAVFFGVLVLGLIAGYVAKVIFQTLGSGKADFVSGLTPLSYAWLLTAVGMIVAVLLNYIPVAGPFLGGLIALYFFALATAVVFRGFKEMFEVDMITVLVGVGLLWGAFGLAASIGTFLGVSQVLSSLASVLAQFASLGAL
jgi:hypothetical protein